MTETIETIEALFDKGLERYHDGEAAATLIPTFKEVCDRAPKSSSAWTCLSWLYLLDSKPTQAAKAAKTAVKLNPQDPQARVNLAIAMLETAQKGVREHIEVAGQIMMVAEDLKEEVEKNIAQGLIRRPDWKSLTQVKNWLLDS
jgi:predicted Zn-dependent protease